MTTTLDPSIRPVLCQFSKAVNQGADVGTQIQYLRQFMVAAGVTPVQLREQLDTLTASNPAARSQWVAILTEHGILPAQSQLRRTAPEPVVSVIEPAMPEIDGYRKVWAKNIVTETASSSLSCFLSGSSRTGKSTLVRALVYKKWEANRNLKLVIVEPQPNRWLGLEKLHEVVHYVADDDMLTTAAQVIEYGYGAMLTRNRDGQNRLRTGSAPQSFSPIFLVFNEWNLIYRAWSGLDASSKRSQKVAQMLRQLLAVIQTGAQVGVSVCLIGQTHRKEDTGISPSVMRNLALLGCGMIHGNFDGGYASLKSLITDRHILCEDARASLANAFAEGSKLRAPLVATTMGIPRIGRLRDFRPLESWDISQEFGGEQWQAG